MGYFRKASHNGRDSRVVESDMPASLTLTAAMKRLAPILIILSALVGHLRAGDAGAEQIEFFEKRVRPVFAEHCYKCHSADAEKIKGGLRLDSREAILKGGDTGAAIVSGEPEKSLLITAVRYVDKDLKMPPPKDGADRKLTDAQLADLAEWVKMGAPIPVAFVSAGDPAKHWAFQPIARPIPPEIRNPNHTIRNEIDRFILAKLDRKSTRLNSSHRH